MTIIYVVIFIILILLIYIFITYNALVKSDNFVKEAFSTMDVYLKKRWDLIPNLVEVVKSYAAYEKDVLNSVTALRNNAYDSLTANNKLSINEQLSSGLEKLLLVAENYPDLKANENFKDLSKNLTQVEDEIANSRKYYNGCVRIFNNKVSMFPSNIIASIFKFKKAKMFEIDTEEKNNVKVDL